MAEPKASPDVFTLETPTAPIPSPEESPPKDAPPAKGRGKGAPPRPPRFPALRAGLAHAWRSRRALLLVLVVQLLLGLTVAAPLHGRLRQHLDHHVQSAAFAGERDEVAKAAGWDAGLDPGVWADFKRVEAPFLEGISAALVWLAVVAWAFGALASGGFLSTGEVAIGVRPGSQVPGEPGPRTCAAFLAGGGRWFWPMLRTSLCFLVLVEGILGRFVFEGWGPVAARSQREAASGWTPWWGERTREAAFVFSFLFFRAAADLARAHLVLRGRRSAVLAFLRGIGTLVRRPLRAGGLALAIGLPEMALLLLCAWTLGLFPGGGVPHLLGAFLVLQAAVLVRWAGRAALLAGNLRLLSDVSRA